jgi:tetratricopeptide (TPR) repeat protein
MCFISEPMRIGALLSAGLLAINSAAAQSLPETLIEAGHWKRARAIVEPRIREYPRDALANFLLSQIRNAFGDHESPLAFAENAVSIDGSVAKYHRQVAEALGVKAQHSGMFQQLILARRFKREIDAAIALDPRDLQALRDLMEFYLLAPGIAGGDKTKARDTAARIAVINPAEGFSAQARLAASNGQGNQIEGLLRKAGDAEPLSYRARIALASFYQSPDHANPQEAERQAKEAVKIDPGRVDGYAILSQIYAARGRWTDLDSLLAIAGRDVPDDLLPVYRAGETLLDSNQEFERAVRYLRQYVAGEPEGNAPTLAEARLKLGLALEKARNRASDDTSFTLPVRNPPE